MFEDRSITKKIKHTSVDLTTGLILLAVLLGVFHIYQPALHGPFVFDDGPNLVENHPLHLHSLDPKKFVSALESVKAGPFGRPVAYASFALNYYFFGPESYSFKLVNLIIHLLNGVCIFILTRILLRAFRLCQRTELTTQKIQWIAIATSSLWMIHPLALTPVLYIVQRMASLAAIFSFLTFIFYFSGRLKQFTGHSGIPQFIVAFGIFTPLAVLSKGNAILIPYLLLVTDGVLLQFKTRSKAGRVVTRGLLLSAIVPLIAGFSIWDNFLGSLLAGYRTLPFTLSEHVLTESRVLWFYLKLIFIPRPMDFGLYHDDFVLSKGLFDPATTIISITGLLFLAIGAIILRKKAPIFSFAILFFLVGHSIESSIFSLEIAHEHRNYLPMYGLILMMAYYGLHSRLIRYGGRTVVTGFILLIGVFATVTINRAMDWRNIGVLSHSLAKHHPHSARSNYEFGRVLTGLIEEGVDPGNTEHYYKIARQHFTRAFQSDKFNPGGLFGIFYLDGLVGKKTDKDTVDILVQRLTENPIPPATATSFSHLHKCHVQKICSIETEVLVDLYNAALTNKMAGKKIRSSLLNELAILKIEQGKVFAGIRLFRKSIKLRPTQPQLRFNLIQTLITNRQLVEAQRELASVRKQFSKLQEPEKLTHLEKMYANASGFADY